MHSGRTDGSYGHHDNWNASGLGSYHWHHGWGPHMHPCAGSGESLIKHMRGFESKGYVVDIYSTTTIPYTYVGIIHVSQNKRIELFITDDENDDDDAFFLIEDGDRQLIEKFWSRELNAQHVINLLSPWKGVDFRVNSDYLTTLLNRYLDTSEPGNDIPTDAVPITIKIIGIDGMLFEQNGFIVNGVSYSYDSFNLFEMLRYTYIDLIYDDDDSTLPREFKIGFLETDISTVSVTNFTEDDNPWICIALNKLRDLGHTVKWDESTRTVLIDYKGTEDKDISFEDAIKKAVILTYSFEGSSFTKITGNFDGQGISFGLLQWNIGQGSLQSLLICMNTEYPAILESIFDDTYEELVSMLADSSSNQLIWAKSINDSNNNVLTNWSDKFTVLGNTMEFQEIQLTAQETYITQAKLIFDDFRLSTERGVALAFDIAVQNWNVKAGTSIINNVTTEIDKLSIIANSVADQSAS